MSEVEALPDLTLCDREPITRLERIQPFGFLLALSKDWIVARASANLGHFLGVEPTAAIGAKIDDFIDPESLHTLRNRMAFLISTQGTERLYGLKLIPGRPCFDVSIHYAGSMIVVEGEPTNFDVGTDAASLVRAMVSRLRMQKTLEDFHRDAARQIRVLTGFDRVLIYRFDESGAGEVISEALTKGMEPLLGLHYPASDVPVQARALYLRNPFRIVADVGAVTVPLVPSGVGIEPLDQSLAITRAVSPVHIEYLRNMGVGASLSISIVVEGSLWGLIACHHGTPRLPSFVIRTAAELFGQMYSMKLERRLRRADDEVDRRTMELVDRIGESITRDEMLLGNAEWWQTSIKGLIECDGVAVALHGMLSSRGSTPPRTDIDALVQKLNSFASHKTFDTDHLAAIYPEAILHAEKAAGVLSIPVSTAPQDYILLFRKEWVQEVTWAGNPEKSVLATDDGLRMSPRKSFAAFRKISHGRARPFTDQNRRTANALRSALVEAVLGFSRHGEEAQIKTAQRQELLIAELNHRIRNIIALIRGLINQSGTHSETVATYVESLDGRIQSLARAHDQITRVNWGPGRLSEMLDQEILAFIPNERQRFSWRGPEVLLHPLAFSTLSLVVHELVTNAAKYGALSGHGYVAVTVDFKAGDGLYIKWRETGGPKVEVPRRRGFGSVILERVVPFDLQGTAQVRYESLGLEADFYIPCEHIAIELAPSSHLDGGKPASGTAATAHELEQQRPLEGMSVLLLEDNLILALETEDLLHGLGADVVFLASSMDAAVRFLTCERLDFALLDVHVGMHTSLEFALSVRDVGIPYVFATGYGEDVDFGPFHPAPAVISKPYRRLAAISVIAKAIRETSAARSRPSTEPASDVTAQESREDSVTEVVPFSNSACSPENPL